MTTPASAVLTMLEKAARSMLAGAAAGLLLVPAAAAAGEVFKDDFEGEGIAAHWQVSNPNEDNYIVEDGNLLIVYQQELPAENKDICNLFTLDRDLPKKNWRITVRIAPEYQTLREKMYFGLYQDAQNYMLGTWYINSWCCYARNQALGVTKNSRGKKAAFVEALAGTGANLGQGQFDAYRGFFQKLGDGVLLRLTKTGRSYVFSGRVEGKDKDGKDFECVELPKLTSLRQKGRFIFAFAQGKSGGGHVGKGGESLVNVDWIKLETLE